MKRDPDLIRAIALETEKLKPMEVLPGIEDVDPYVFAEHAKLMQESGLLEAEISYFLGAEAPRVWVKRLTMDGHDFLDSARSDTLWIKAKESIISEGSSWTIGLLVEWLKAEIRNGFPTLRGS